MYIVRNVQVPSRYVVAIRGTNPIASSDWLFGDFLVGTTVQWPYANDNAAISTSTALGLAMLQDMRPQAPSIVARFAEASSAAVRDALDGLIRSGRAWVSGTTEALAAHPLALTAQVEKIVAHWLAHKSIRDDLRDQLQRAAATVRVNPADLKRKPLPATPHEVGVDLLTFLKQQADTNSKALEVIVTGHSKGGALAPTVALWLTDALNSPDPAECWDARRRAEVLSYAFAGPTPGNAALANRIDQVLGRHHHHLRNMNDIVTQAWQEDDLQHISNLYGSRSAPFGPLLRDIIADVQKLDYRHAPGDIVTFTGGLDLHRSLGMEIVYQHMDAYLAELKLLEQGITAATFFI